MATFRTPVPTFHANVSFVSNGELGSQTVLNRPMFSLDDKIQYLKNQQDTILTDNAALRSNLGESQGVDTPVWNTPTYFAQGASHHAAIEGLDQGLSQLASSTDFTRIDNIDTFLIGEDSTSGLAPDWSTLRTPLFVQLGDTHHQAIDRLDAGASILRGEMDTTLGNVSTLQSQMGTVITDLGDAQVAIAALQGGNTALSTLVDTHTSQIDTLDSQLVLTRTEVSQASSELNDVSVVTNTNSCVIEKMKSQINELRADEGRAAITVWCP